MSIHCGQVHTEQFIQKKWLWNHFSTLTLPQEESILRGQARSRCLAGGVQESITDLLQQESHFTALYLSSPFL